MLFLKALFCLLCLGLFLYSSYKGVEFMDLGKNFLGVMLLVMSVVFCCTAMFWWFSGHIAE